MLFTGNAFRPPRRERDEQWSVAEQLVRAGYLYHATSNRQRMPRTRHELEQWFATRERDPGWLPERTLVSRPDGTLQAGSRIVRHGEEVLVLVAGQWKAATVRLRGDGARSLSSPVIALLSSRRYVAIDAQTRLRLRRRVNVTR